MFHFTIGMGPDIARIGPFTLAWHGLLTAIAIFLAVAVIYRGFIRHGLPVEKFDSLAFWTIVGGILGARLFFVIDHAGYMIQNPLQAFAIQEGGLAIYGAVFGGFIAVAILTRIYNYPFGKVVDVIAPGLLLAQAVGRLGDVINGDAWGAPTSLPFALIYTNPKALLPANLLGVPTFPYPIFDVLLNLAVLAIIWRLAKRQLPDGAIFAFFALLYALGRFPLSYMRQEKIWFWGLQEAQVIAAVAFIAAAIALVWLLRREQPVPAVATAD